MVHARMLPAPPLAHVHRGLEAGRRALRMLAHQPADGSLLDTPLCEDLPHLLRLARRVAEAHLFLIRVSVWHDRLLPARPCGRAFGRVLMSGVRRAHYCYCAFFIETVTMGASPAVRL